MIPFPGPLMRASDGCHPYVLNAEQESWLRATFPVTENRVIEKAMGVTHPTLYRIVLQLGIRKSGEGMKAIRQRQGDRHRQMVKYERVRMLSGYRHEKYHNIRLKPYTKSQVLCRYKAVKLYGYMVYAGNELRDDDDDRYKIFYNEETKRCGRFEDTCRRHGLTIEKEKL